MGGPEELLHSDMLGFIEGSEGHIDTPLTTAGAQDWQIVEDGSLSQCGSTPRSLSHKDFDASNDSLLDIEGVPGTEAADFAGQEEDTDSHTETGVPTSLQARELSDSNSEEQGLAEALEEVSAGMKPRDEDLLQADASSDDASSVSSITTAGVDEGDELTPTEGPLPRGSKTPESAFSGASSYADAGAEDDLSSASELVSQALADSLSASVISDMLAAVEAASEGELPSDSEENLPPHNNPFSLGTGQPLEELFLNQRQPLDAEQLSSCPNSELASQSSVAVSATAGEHLPPPGLAPPGACKWGKWLPQSSSSRTAKLLHRIWYQLQVVVKSAGNCIPPSLRRRVTGVLKFLDSHIVQGGKGSVYVAYGAAVVGFVLALRYYRECSRLRQLNLAQKDDFDMHVLKVLDLNEKLGRGMSIPITYNCGFKDLSFPRGTYPQRPLGMASTFLTVVP